MAMRNSACSTARRDAGDRPATPNGRPRQTESAAAKSGNHFAYRRHLRFLQNPSATKNIFGGVTHSIRAIGEAN